MENYWGQWEEGRRTGRDQQERGERIREGKWEVKMINVQWNVYEVDAIREAIILYTKN